MNSTKTNRQQLKVSNTFDSTFKRYLMLFLVIILFILFLPYLLTHQTWLNFGFTDKDGVVGDAIGGTMGPFVAIAASMLTFLAFWVQYKANEQQRSDLKIERFENKFYELLNLHQSNVLNMSISSRVFGRKCFQPLFNELKTSYDIVTREIKKSSKEELALFGENNIDSLRFSYTLFFYGVGVNSEKQYVPNFNKAEKILFDKCRGVIEELQNGYNSQKKTYPDKNYYTLNVPFDDNSIENRRQFHYQPFDGHAELLGNYYRNLFQLMNYITNHSDTYFTDEIKYSYVKTLRAQLSNYEQLLLFYNAMAWFKEEWKEFFTTYRLIKNLPVALADFGALPLDVFKEEILQFKNKGIDLFEFSENRTK
jgi:hypothetical protein